MAGFTHKTSRALDPQLHEHLVILNVGIGSDGRWRWVDSRGLYAHKMMASAVFRAELRDRLFRLGYRWDKIDERGLAELAGFRPQVLEEFSTRSRQIAAYLADQGLERTSASAQHATLATRQTKVDVEFQELRTTWAERAEALGLTATMLDGLRGEGRSNVLSKQAIETITRRCSVRRGSRRGRPRSVGATSSAKWWPGCPTVLHGRWCGTWSAESWLAPTSSRWPVTVLMDWSVIFRRTGTAGSIRLTPPGPDCGRPGTRRRRC